ncbi:MAG TPA: response regulator [Chitinophagaceae bacterium]|nr:response regulator [Chitinophagaceae bacterium]
MPESSPKKHIVVYADDDLDDIDLVKEAFHKYTQNVELVVFRNGEDALIYLLSMEAEFPCLVILDINMPLMGGLEVLSTIRNMKAFDDTPIILFTTSSQQFEKNYAKKYKAGFITKPIDYRQMQYITDTFIEHCSEDIKKKISRSVNL